MDRPINERLAADLALARRLAQGEAAAVRAFFDEYFDRLYRFALARVDGDHAACEDVVQAALIRALDRIAGYRGEAALFTWCCTICRNEIVDARRRGDLPNGRTALIDDQPEVRAMLDALAATSPDGELATPLAAAQRAEVAALVRAVLDHLPRRYGDALEWRYALGLTVEEVGARLGITTKAAESVLGRAKQAFREGFAATAASQPLN